MGTLHGHKFYNDNFVTNPQKEFKIKKEKIFKLWKVIVRERKDLTGEEFVEAFPKHI
jgi:hypothetical protein